MEGSAKIKLSNLVLSNAYANGLWVDSETILKLILGFKWTSEATWKADVIKYANEDRPNENNYPPHKNFRFCAPGGRDQGGKASHASSPFS